MSIVGDKTARDERTGEAPKTQGLDVSVVGEITQEQQEQIIDSQQSYGSFDLLVPASRAPQSYVASIQVPPIVIQVLLGLDKNSTDEQFRKAIKAAQKRLLDNSGSSPPYQTFVPGKKETSTIKNEGAAHTREVVWTGFKEKIIGKQVFLYFPPGVGMKRKTRGGKDSLIQVASIRVPGWFPLHGSAYFAYHFPSSASRQPIKVANVKKQWKSIARVRGVVPHPSTSGLSLFDVVGSSTQE